MPRKRNDETFTTFDFDAIFADDTDSGARLVCINNRDVYLLLPGLIQACWGSRWVGKHTDFGYPTNLLREGGRDNDLRTATDYVNNLIWRLITMDCGENIKLGLDAIASAIAGLNPTISNTQTVNCGGTVVNVPITNAIQGALSDGTPIYGGTPTSTTDPGTPEGMTNEQWAIRRCQNANFVFDAIVGSLHAIATLDIALLVQSGAAMSAIVAALAFGVIAPEIAIPALVAALLGIIGLGASLGSISDVADYWESHRADIVCNLFSSTTIQEATEVVKSWIDEALLALAITTGVGLLIKTVTAVIASTDTLAQLFNVATAIAYPDADCSECNPTNCEDSWSLVPENLSASFSKSSAGDEYTYIVGSVEYAGYGPYFIGLATPDGCGSNMEWSLEGGTWTPVSGEYGYTIDGLGGFLGMSNGEPAQADNRKSIAARSTTPFTLRVVVTPYTP